MEAPRKIAIKISLKQPKIRLIIVKKLNISRDKFDLMEGEYAKKWLVQNNIDYNEISDLLLNKKTWKNYRNSIKQIYKPCHFFGISQCLPATCILNKMWNYICRQKFQQNQKHICGVFLTQI